MEGELYSQRFGRREGGEGLSILPRVTHPRIWFARGNPRFDRKLYTELVVMSIVSTNNRI